MGADRRGATKRKCTAQFGDRNNASVESSSRVKRLDSTIFGGWLDEGVSRGERGTIVHQGFWIWVGGKRLEFVLGDTAFVRCEPRTKEPFAEKDPVKASTISTVAETPATPIGVTTSSTKNENEMVVARIERIWEAKKPPPSATKSDTEDLSSPFMFRARWFLKVSSLNVCSFKRVITHNPCYQSVSHPE